MKTFSRFLSTAWKCVVEKRHCDNRHLCVRAAAFALTSTSTPMTVYGKKNTISLHTMMRIHHSEDKTELYCKRAEMQRIHSTYFILHMCSATLRLVTKAKNTETLISHTSSRYAVMDICRKRQYSSCYSPCQCN